MPRMPHAGLVHRALPEEARAYARDRGTQTRRGARGPARRAMTPAAREARLWYWQRVSAMVLALCVLVHLATVIYAVRGGLTAGEILGRTRGSVAFGVFYLVFLAACAVHVPIGLAAIVEEW